MITPAQYFTLLTVCESQHRLKENAKTIAAAHNLLAIHPDPQSDIQLFAEIYAIVTVSVERTLQELELLESHFGEVLT